MKRVIALNISNMGYPEMIHRPIDRKPLISCSFNHVHCHLPEVLSHFHPISFMATTISLSFAKWIVSLSSNKFRCYKYFMGEMRSWLIALNNSLTGVLLLPLFGLSKLDLTHNFEFNAKFHWWEDSSRILQSF